MATVGDLKELVDDLDNDDLNLDGEEFTVILYALGAIAYAMMKELGLDNLKDLESLPDDTELCKDAEKPYKDLLKLLKK
jgi:hypothetical protein